MSGGFETVLIDIIGRDRASGAFDKAAASAERSAKKMNGAVASAGAVGAKMSRKFTVPLLAIAAVSTKVAVDYQKSMTLLQTAGGESSAKIAVISEGIKKVAIDTGTSLGQLTEGMYTVAKAGSQKWSAVDQLKVLKAAAQGAKAEGVDLGTSTNALTSIMMSYHMSASQAVAAENMLIVGAGKAKVSMQDYAGSLSTVIPIASASGVKFQEVAAAIATLTQHGTSADESTQEIANTIRNLAAPTLVAQKALGQLGLKANDLTLNLKRGGKGGGLAGTLDMVENALAKSSRGGMVVVSAFKRSQSASADLQIMLSKMPKTLADNSRAFLNGKMSQNDYRKAIKSLGAEGFQMGSNFLALTAKAKGFSDVLRNGSPAQQTAAAQLKAILGGATGLNTALQLGGENAGYFHKAIDEVGAAARKSGADVFGWSKTSGTLAFKASQAKANLQVLALEIGTALIPVVSKIVAKVTDAVHWFERLSPSTKKIIGISALVVAALGPVITIVSRVTLAVMTLGRTTGKLIGWGAAAVKSGARVVQGMRNAEMGMAAMQTRSYAVGLRLGTVFSSIASAAGSAGRYVATSFRAAGSALSAVPAAVGAASGFGGKLAAVGTGIAGVGKALGPMALGIAGAGVVISSALGAWDRYKQHQKDVKATTDSLTQSIIADNGALGQNTRAQVVNLLQSKGAYDAALKLGISQKTLTDAFLGSKPALHQLTDAMSTFKGKGLDGVGAIDKLKDVVPELKGELKGAASQAANYTAAMAGTAGPTRSAASGTRDLAASLHNTYAEQVPAFTSGLSKINAWYGQVSKSGKTFIASVQAFAKSGGTVADRGALIGQTLVAANGNALNYAASMNDAAVAHHRMIRELQAAAKDAFPKSANAAKAYAADIVNLQTGTINYSRKGAGTLISGLQGMQTAAMNAASATFRLAREHEGGKQAADDAYKVYKAKTSGMLIDEAAKLGLTGKQAGALAKHYFNMPKRVKTLLEAEGTNPIVTVLNKIGTQLSFLTGHVWQPKVDANVETAINNIRRVGNALEGLHNKTIEVKTFYTKNGKVTERANGGAVHGPGTKTSDSIAARLSNGEHVWTADEVAAAGGQGAMYRARGMVRAGLMKFAAGGAVGGITHSGKDWIYAGTRYASERAAKNAQARAKKTDQGTLSSTASSAIGTVGQASTKTIDVASVGIARISAQIANARKVLQQQVDKGLSSKAAAAFRSQINNLAKEAAKQLAALKVKIGHADVSALKTAVHGTVDDARAAFATLLSDSRAAGLAAWRIASITRSQAKITSDMRQRDSLQAQLGSAPTAPSAYDKLANARSNWGGEHDSAKAAVLGGFDITTAGASTQVYGDQAAAPTTGKSILSSLKAMVAKAKTFRSVLGKLAGMGLAPTLLSKFAQAGPDALDQAQALLSGGAGTIKEITKQYKILDASAASTGRLSADQMFGKDVNDAQTGVANLTKSIGSLNSTIDKLAKGVAHVVAPPKSTHKAGTGGKGHSGGSSHHTAGSSHAGRSVVINGGIHITQQKDPVAAANAVTRRLAHLGAS